MSECVICLYCNTNATLVDGSYVYLHRQDLWKKDFWVCRNCDARVGCHPGTVKPLGRLANAELRGWKMQAHAAFDPLWKTKRIGSRSKAYSWLADKLKINKCDCHMGMFDVDMCKRVVGVCDGFTSGS